MPDGSPQVTPVWFDYTDGRVRVNTAKGRTKARNMTEGARVALAIVDPDNPYRYVQVRGRVKRCTEQGADRHIDSGAITRPRRWTRGTQAEASSNHSDLSCAGLTRASRLGWQCRASLNEMAGTSPAMTSRVALDSSRSRAITSASGPAPT
jgi:PPOX class probable F420-dependent enzyme